MKSFDPDCGNIEMINLNITRYPLLILDNRFVRSQIIFYEIIIVISEEVKIERGRKKILISER